MDAKQDNILPNYQCGSIKKGKVMVIDFPESKDEECNLNIEKEMLLSTFQTLGYEPETWQFELRNTTYEVFMNEIERVSVELQSSESFVMAILCPQKMEKLCLPNGTYFDMESIYLKFNAEKCKAMVGKPKIFIFHTHPYRKPLGKENLSSGTPATQMPPEKPVVTIPLEADMLVVHSYEDYMDKTGSSIFIRELTEVLKDNFKKINGQKDILELMVDVSAKIVEKNQNISLPTVMSTLNDLYYIRKINNEIVNQ